MKQFTYLDNAATTFPKPETVYAVMDEVNRNYAVNAGRGAYRKAQYVSGMIAETKEKLKNLVGADKDASVVFCPSVTVALNQIINGLGLRDNSYVYYSPYEHNAVARTLYYLAKRKNIHLREIPMDDATGEIEIDKEFQLDQTEKMLNKFFKLTYRDIERAYYKRTKEENVIHYQLMLTKNISGKRREIDFSLESTGTQSLIQLLPFMLVVVKGSVTIIDEFDTGIHDLLVQNLVTSLFNELEGQLIMTTHNTLLMESKSIPKECIYVINELNNEYKEIQCITHYDSKIHQNTNIRDQYMLGKYMGIPEISHINFSDLLDSLTTKS